MSGTGADDPAGFLARWSARKRAEAVEQAPPDPAPPEPLPEPEPESADEEFLASLPRIEDIGPGTDIRGFMQKGVPRALRNAALRRAWVANPAIANYEDPARDYFWDYNAAGGMPGSGGTIRAEDAQRMAGRILNGPPPADPPLPEAAAAGEPPAATESPVDTAPVEQASEAPVEAPVAAAAPPPRRHGGAVPT